MISSHRYHIIIDLTSLDQAIINDQERLRTFLTQLPSRIGMSILYGPVVVEGIPENPGLTGFVIIDYSHISVHTFTNSQEVLLDIFSCKPYDQDEAVQAALECFQATPQQARIKEVFWE